MKKEYIAPSMEIIEIEGECILAVSGNDTVNISNDGWFNDAINAPYKKHTSLWDDED